MLKDDDDLFCAASWEQTYRWQFSFEHENRVCSYACVC